MPITCGFNKVCQSFISQKRRVLNCYPLDMVTSQKTCDTAIKQVVMSAYAGPHNFTEHLMMGQSMALLH